MPEIELTKNQITIVDDIDFDLADLKWCAHWNKNTQSYYALRNIRVGLKYKTQRMHRIILSRILGRELLRSELVDHINHDTLDNRRENLRLATASQNGMNHRKRSDNTSGYTGVTWNKWANKWRTYIRLNRKWIHLGYFDDPIAAAIAYDQAAKELFGEFALLNFPD